MRNIWWIVAAVVMTLPGMWLRLSGTHPGPATEALLYGLAILGAAFLLSWAVEVAQLDLAQAFAVAILAFIAVLPEYAVDIYFAYASAERPEYAAYAAANMTGANRLLVGIGWPLIAIVFWLRTRARSVGLRPEHRLELLFLGLATVYAFILPLKANISLFDSIVLVGLFGMYIWATTRAPTEEPDLVGPAALIGALPTNSRRTATALMFLFAAVAILASAEPFAEGLVATGEVFGIDEFLLVQWLAPLASEAPEVVLAIIFTLRRQPVVGMGALLSSKVNQWTLLVGSLPIAYSAGLGGFGALELDARQQEEVLLTAAQSAFAMVLLLTLRLSLPGAAALLGLFVFQLAIPDPTVRLVVSGVYVAAAVMLVVASPARRQELVHLVPRVWQEVRTAEGPIVEVHEPAIPPAQQRR